MAIFSGLILSIKRSQFRANDRGAAAADAEYRTARPRALESQGWRCYACRLVSKLTNEIHHLGRHDDNRPEQLKCACWLCHAYGHVGQAAVGPGGSDSSVEALGRKTVMGYVPELSATDLNNLQRVLGLALLDAGEKAMAEEIAKHLMARAKPVQESWGSYHPADFALCMARLPEDMYEARDEPLAGLRLIFNFGFLKDYASRLLQERNWQAMPVRTWATLAEGHLGDSQ